MPISSSLLQTGDVSSLGETATLKTSHCLRRGQITDWKSVIHYALDACPYSRGAHGLTLLWEMEGKKEKKEKPLSEPSPLASGQRGERLKSPLIFFLSAYTRVFWSESSHLCFWPGSRQDLAGFTQCFYFPDQPSKDPDSLTCSGKVWLLNHPALGALVFKANGTNVLVSWPSPVRWKWIFRPLLAKMGFISPLHHCYHFLLPFQPRDRTILLPLEPLGPVSKTLK